MLQEISTFIGTAGTICGLTNDPIRDKCPSGATWTSSCRTSSQPLTIKFVSARMTFATAAARQYSFLQAPSAVWWPYPLRFSYPPVRLVLLLVPGMNNSMCGSVSSIKQLQVRPEYSHTRGELVQLRNMQMNGCGEMLGSRCWWSLSNQSQAALNKFWKFQCYSSKNNCRTFHFTLPFFIPSTSLTAEAGKSISSE